MMLSFIVRLANEFEQNHGMRPNLLYINDFHLSHLQRCFDTRLSAGDIARMLEVEIVLDRDLAHPHVAWRPALQRRAV